VLVVDASVLVVALADDGPDGDRARQRLRGEQLAAPELIDLEVGSVLRRQNRAGQIGDRRAEMAIHDLAAIPMQRASHSNLLGRCWELRQNLTFYDSAYVALAEALQVTLLTGDRRLSRAAGPSCPIETITPMLS
jgi:predicted nucleic acid-binding protein